MKVWIFLFSLAPFVLSQTYSHPISFSGTTYVNHIRGSGAGECPHTQIYKLQIIQWYTTGSTPIDARFKIGCTRTARPGWGDFRDYSVGYHLMKCSAPLSGSNNHCNLPSDIYAVHHVDRYAVGFRTNYDTSSNLRSYSMEFAKVKKGFKLGQIRRQQSKHKNAQWGVACKGNEVVVGMYVHQYAYGPDITLYCAGMIITPAPTRIPTRSPTMAPTRTWNAQAEGDEHGKGYFQPAKDWNEALPQSCKYCIKHQCRRHCIQAHLHKIAENTNSDRLVILKKKFDEAQSLADREKEQLTDATKRFKYHQRKSREWDTAAKDQHKVDLAKLVIQQDHKDIISAEKKVKEAKSKIDAAAQKRKAEEAKRKLVRDEIKAIEKKIVANKAKQTTNTDEQEILKKKLTAKINAGKGVRRDGDKLKQDLNKKLGQENKHTKIINTHKESEETAGKAHEEAKKHHQKMKDNKQKSVDNSHKLKKKAQDSHDIAREKVKSKNFFNEKLHKNTQTHTQQNSKIHTD